MIDFSDQVAVVTGAGRGLGRLYALEIARRGAAVVVNDLGTASDGAGEDHAVADDVVAEITAAGGSAVASYDSVDDPTSAAAIIDRAIETFGRVDVVVSNAGIFGTVDFDELTVEQWQRMRSVHLDGAFYLSQPAYRAMKSQGYGRFVFISSSAGVFGQPASAHYAAAKAGVVGLANVIAIEGEAHGIQANCVLPFGFSRMVTETVGLDAEAAREGSEFFRAIAPELVVPAVIYLASRDCSVTHQVYSALAGRFARVFSGLADGWTADRDAMPTAEDFAEHFAQISATDPYFVPGSIFEEIGQLVGRLGLTS
ncbi:MAG TPA: SDR family NAD(P)-dependent oxidoreductase [Mycobacteriales bacterium]|nr:SDR family NAD(P)-dependent oxidoreductase [Mycobacteriales bacterium]